jgi:arginine decarboxylase
MNQQYKAPWSIQQAIELYGIERWGNDYFGVSDEGNLTVKTLNTAVPLLDIIKGMEERDHQMPVLLRIENILDAQIKRLNDAFANAIESAAYQATYRGVYPIKVNQQAQVVEEIAYFGARYNHGFEVGSKAEMIAALSTLEAPGSLLICNGYKDEEFIELGLQAIQLGLQCYFVIETPTELPIILERSKALGVEPLIGVRVKMTTENSGHWNSTSGDRSVFGLTTTQLINVIDDLKKQDKLHCLKLLHCHLGSQIPKIQEIRSGVVEACRFYVDLVNEGAELTHLDLGGGLAVDYSGENSSEEQSRNYSLEEYCVDIVETIKDTLDEYEIKHPTIVTESGRATVAYSSILLFNILDITTFEPSQLSPSDTAQNHPSLENMREVLNYLTPNKLQECFNDAHYYRDEIRELFKHGQLDLRSRSEGENLFLEILQKIYTQLETLDRIPSGLEDLKESLADIYYGNFSLFQSLPDIWAIDQLFPIVPIHRLDEEPTRQGVLADITCDCEGKIDHFIAEFDTNKTLALHPLRDGEEYYLGVFLVGAYQETLGDLHNLFGDTNVVSVRLNSDKSFDFVKEIHGDTIADVLSYVEYEPKEMELKYRNIAERAVKEGRITALQRQKIMKTFNASLQGYTYYEKEN